jgi:hypothetical protein
MQVTTLPTYVAACSSRSFRFLLRNVSGAATTRAARMVPWHRTGFSRTSAQHSSLTGQLKQIRIALKLSLLIVCPITSHQSGFIPGELQEPRQSHRS